MTAMKISLPWPPTVNTYWRSVLMPRGKGSKEKMIRVLLSKEGREYRERASAAIREQKIPTNAVSGKLEVEIIACPPDRRARDLDNLFKGLLDALKANKVIRDDADIDDLHIRRGHVVKDGQIQITLAEIPGAATASGDLFGSSEGQQP